MANPTGSSAGTTDLVFINRLREFMEDVPLFSPQNTQATGGSSEYRAVDFPLYDGDPYNDSAQRFVITVGSPPVVQTLVDSRSDLTGPNQVAVDYENGWMYWHPSYPPSGPLLLRASKVRWRDQRMLEALYGGLRAMSRVCRQDQVDTTITLQVLVWEYPMSPIFWDPNTRITNVEVLDIPYALNRYAPIDWHRGSMTTLVIPESQAFTPGAQLRIRFQGGYQSLADLPESEQQLPLLWAKGYLLSNKEIVRVRQDTANVSADQNANPVGSSQNAGAFFFSQFERELQRMQRVMPMARPASTYSR
jgi:hypothetical protein